MVTPKYLNLFTW